MRRRGLVVITASIVLIALAAACSFTGLHDVPGDGGSGDGPPVADAMIDAIPGDADPLCAAWDPQHFDACDIPTPGMDPWVISGDHV